VHTSNQALLIIDVQNAILRPAVTLRQAQNRAALDAVIARIAVLIERAQERGVPVLFVQHDAAPGHRLEKNTPGWQIRPEIAPEASVPVIHKSECDSFFETALSSELQARKIGQLIVAGCMTQYCIDTTVRRAVSMGYDVTLVADGHMTEDSGALTFEQIIDHHNAVLDGLSAGLHSVRVVAHDRITF
jgi:nicotinamidase-related amidase